MRASKGSLNDVYTVPHQTPRLKWWNGYLGQSVVVIDEYTYDPTKDRDILLDLCDRYQR